MIVRTTSVKGAEITKGILKSVRKKFSQNSAIEKLLLQKLPPYAALLEELLDRALAGEVKNAIVSVTYRTNLFVSSPDVGFIDDYVKEINITAVSFAHLAIFEIKHNYSENSFTFTFQLV